MVQRVEIVLEDDLSGGVATETVKFSLDDKTYQIDLNKENAAELREAFKKYIDAGRKTAGGKRPAKKPKAPSKAVSGVPSTPAKPRRKRSKEPKKIREWAREQGLTVPDRGRVPKAISDAYEESQRTPTASAA